MPLRYARSNTHRRLEEPGGWPEAARSLDPQGQRLSVIWTRTLALLMLVVMGLGCVAFASTLYQRAAFDKTTRQLEIELDATVALVRELRTIDIPMGSIFYQFGTEAELEEHVSTFIERRDKIDAAFDHARRVIPARGAADPLKSARVNWVKTADAVLAARDLWGTSVVSDALAAGRDPFEQEWSQLRTAQGELTELTAQSLAALRDRTTSVNRVQRVIPPVVLGALMLTLLIGMWSASRLSRRVVAPMLELREAATRMRDGDLQTPVAVGNAAVELHDLARVMNELAGSLHTSHGLLRVQAHTDALTGLPNRKALTEHVLRLAEFGDPKGLAVLFIDLDDFKDINDTLGHDAGDALLRVVGSRLRSAAREGDLVARLGGDEFAVILEHGYEPRAAVAAAERILAALGDPVPLDGRAVTVGCSIGIALSGGSDQWAADDLLRNADVAMYMAKGRGKNRLELFSPAMHTEMLARMNLKADLAHAVARDELELHYQPIVDLNGDTVLGWEALVRWRHPDRGLVAPLEFIPMAEDTGDILAIGDWVLDRACRDFARVLRGSAGPDQWISVNMSARQLMQPDFTASVRRALLRWGLDPASIVLEITEAALVTNTVEAAGSLRTLQDAGIRIALDDFGTGFSSLKYLQQLPVDIIKIDRSFVTRSGGAERADMLDAIVTLGLSLGLDMIAEGIEESDELDRLRGFDRVAGQGYLIGRPMPLAQAGEFALTLPPVRATRAGLAMPRRSC